MHFDSEGFRRGILTYVVLGDRIIKICAPTVTSRRDIKQAKAAYESAVKKTSKQPSVIDVHMMMRADRKDGSGADIVEVASTMQNSHHLPIGVVFASRRTATGQISGFTIGALLTEPERRKIFGKLAFIFGPAAPYNPLSPYYMDLGPESAVPQSIRDGNVPHPHHRTRQ